MIRNPLPLLALAAMIAFAVPTHAQQASVRGRVVMQVSDNDPSKWNLALNNAKNIQTDLGAPNVDIEIVAYGPGINMLKADSVVGNRVDEAIGAGVKVVACENTMRNQKLGKEDMLPKVGYVSAGVVELMQKQQQGWAYITPVAAASWTKAGRRARSAHGHADRYLSDDEVRDIVRAGLDAIAPDGKRILFIIPDGTRTMPMPQMFALFREHLGAAREDVRLPDRARHAPADGRRRVVGASRRSGRRTGVAGTSRVFNHAWDKPETFTTIGTIPAEEIAELSGGRLAQDVPVSLNRLIFDYDHIVICGPVFPHEVVGFSGGNKYFFPGIAGAEVINFTHWLGALITNYEVIGSGYTPVRAVIDRAASMVTVPTSCFALVVTQGRHRGTLLRRRARGVGEGRGAVVAAAHRVARQADERRCCP